MSASCELSYKQTAQLYSITVHECLVVLHCCFRNKFQNDVHYYIRGVTCQKNVIDRQSQKCEVLPMKCKVLNPAVPESLPGSES